MPQPGGQHVAVLCFVSSRYPHHLVALYVHCLLRVSPSQPKLIVHCFVLYIFVRLAILAQRTIPLKLAPSCDDILESRRLALVVP
jgi:hypothetical protein